MFFNRGVGGRDSTITTKSTTNITTNNFKQITDKISTKNKKGQVTIFIILGILLLLSVALILLLRAEQVGFEISEIIPTKKGVVEEYISSCINEVGSDALSLIGLQGGYIEVPERYTDDINWHIPVSDFIAVPLWGSGNLIDRPSISQIKNDVDEYVEENVRNCLFENEINGGEFDEIYTLIELDDIVSDVKFEDSHTDFDVTWDIVVQDKSGEVLSEIIQHSSRSDVQFKTMYDTASDILDTEMLELKLEDITQDLISLEHDNLPVAGMEISCAPKQWRTSQVEETLKEMLRINIRALRVEGTSFTEYSEAFPYYQNHYTWNIDGEVSEDVEVNFRYENNYPFTFQVTPTSGGLMKSNQLGGGKLLDFLCLQQWKFTYDVVYPVMIQVYDEDTGAVLQMGVSVNLVTNYPDKGGVVYARESYFGNDAVNEEEYCQDSSYVLPVSVTTYSEISNGANGVYYRETLEDVNISYTCLLYTCPMGASEYDYEQRGDVAGLTALIPYCAGGILRGEKDGYLDTWTFTDVREGDEHELNLRPLLSFPLSQVEIVKHTISSYDCGDDEPVDNNGLCVTVDTDGSALDEDETVLVNLRMLDDDIEIITGQDVGSNESTESELSDEFAFFALEEEGNEVHSVEFVMSPTFEEEFLTEAVVDLLYGADFEYELIITLVNEEELLGGYEGIVTLPWSGLGAAETLKFHVFDIKAGDDEFYTILGGLEEYTNLIPDIEVE
ncbi:hypothetical protein HOC96_07660 [archaeon]|nr:hypothetical protein [archaeon]